MLTQSKFSSLLSYILYICIGFSLHSCSERQPTSVSGALPSIFPDYTETTIPCNIAPLNFGVEEATFLCAEISCEGREPLVVEGSNTISFSQQDWQLLLSSSKGKSMEVKLSVWSEKSPSGITYKPFKIYVSNDSIDPWIMYRLIPPGYEGWRYMGIYQRNMSSFDVEPIMENSQNNFGCVNCHSVANYSPNYFMLHARGAGGGTVISTPSGIEKVAIEKIGPMKGGSYNVWHPSGRFIAFSSNATHQNFYGYSRDKIEVYDTRSDIIIYDVKYHDIIADVRFNDSINWETFPTFSPDGKYLYFSTARAVTMPVEYNKLNYSIVRVPFNDDGTLGAQIDTLYSASRQGGSALMPKISPDGRYMLFTWAECGAFHIYHKEADYRMLDLQTLKMVDVKEINSSDSESYHSWSSNGKWVMFSSKRGDTRYTRNYFSHWDGTRFSKPFILPQQSPLHDVHLLYSYNIPEFLLQPVRLDKDQVAGLFE